MSKVTQSNLRKTILAGALLAFGSFGMAACGAEADDENVGSIEEAIGVSCGSKEPSKVVSGGFSTTHTSATTYTDCFKGKIVQIDDYAPEYAVGGHTEVRWGDAVPSTADCTGSSVGAYLFEKQGDAWILISKKGAHGDLLNDDEPSDIVNPPRQPPRPTTGPVPIPPGAIPGPIRTLPVLCRTPRVFFYADEMREGESYKIVASARLPGAVTRKVSFVSTAGTCGQDSLACCWSGPECVSGEACDASTSKCEQCGARGELCCEGNSCDSSSLTCKSGACVTCGGSGQACCGSTCGNGLTCQSGTCKTPPPQPTCGRVGEDCCQGATECKTSDLSCQLGKCKVRPADSCGGVGGVCCSSGSPCNSPLACQEGIAGKRCSPLDGFCNNPGEACCLVMSSLVGECQSSSHFPRLTCNSKTNTCQ